MWAESSADTFKRGTILFFELSFKVSDKSTRTAPGTRFPSWKPAHRISSNLGSLRRGHPYATGVALVLHIRLSLSACGEALLF